MTTTATSLLRPLRDHWHGRHSIWITLLVTVIGLRAIISYLPPLFPDLKDPLPFYSFVGTWFALNLALLTWQAVGTHRATEHLAAPPADATAVWVGHGTLLLAIILAVLQTIDGIAAVYPAKPKHTPAVEIKLPLSDGGKTVTISQDISYAITTALEDLIEHKPQLTTVVLNSDGGHIFAARTLANIITRSGLNTHSTGRCYSACTIAFMGGEERTLAAQAKLGFHQYQMSSRMQVQTVRIDVQQNKDRAFFASRGVSKAFLDRMFQAPHASIWTPNHDELRRAGILKTR